MLHFEIAGEELRVAQSINPPSVYLDHWALREISESDVLSRRFSKVLKGQGGTLALSWLNVAEFSKVADDAQRRKADSFLDTLSPNLFWLNPDFFTVSKNEELSSGQALSILPHSDHEFAHAYVMIGLAKYAKPPDLGPRSFFSAIRANPKIRNQYDDLADQIVSQIEWLRRTFESSKEMQLAVKTGPQAGSFSRGTRIIAGNLIGRFLKDKLRKPGRNDAIDLSHAVVSVSYCDYVLLDGQWAAMVNDLREHIAKTGVSIPMAKVFSKRANGLEEFLKELEARPNKAEPDANRR